MEERAQVLHQSYGTFKENDVPEIKEKPGKIIMDIPRETRAGAVCGPF